ncbi:MAG TPA: GNAT family N-acetyltransferase [Gammaproteobacteria bacterium]
MKLTTVESLKDIPADAWNALAGNQNPFVQHDFLLALETGQCLQPYGWYPQYILAYDNNELVGASPAYIKTNSYGEFVFDWAWADAYKRAQLDYYPKLIIAVPYSPITGPRLLAKNNDSTIKQALVTHAIDLVQQQNLSSVHWLFNTKEDHQIELDHGLMPRFDYQFHWQNHHYQNFDDFLAQLSSKKRKNIKRERRLVKDAGIDIKTIIGTDLTDQQWQQVYDFYQITFMKKFGTATLSLNFFKAIAHKLLAILAYDKDRAVAGAICILGKDTLYGRHWGCYEEYDSLHFEVCYYTGIDYCIQNNLKTFEPGAQGEHKIARGFLPTRTLSSHWIAHPTFRNAIADFLQREAKAMEGYGEDLKTASPFRNTEN